MPAVVRNTFERPLAVLSAVYADVPFVRPVFVEEARAAVGGGGDHYELCARGPLGGGNLPPTGGFEGQIVVLEPRSDWHDRAGRGKLGPLVRGKVSSGDVLRVLVKPKGLVAVVDPPDATMKGVRKLGYIDPAQQGVNWHWIAGPHARLRPLVAQEDRAAAPDGPGRNAELSFRAARACPKAAAACDAAARGQPVDFDALVTLAAFDAQLRAAPTDARPQKGRTYVQHRVAELRALLWLEEAATAADLAKTDVHDVRLENVAALPPAYRNPYSARAETLPTGPDLLRTSRGRHQRSDAAKIIKNGLRLLERRPP